MKRTTLLILLGLLNIVAFQLVAQQDTYPVYPGGKAAFSKYFADNIKVPDNIRTSKIKPEYTFSFSLDNNGNVIESSYSLDDLPHDIQVQVEKLLNEMPQWSSRCKGVDCDYGYKVNVAMTFPLKVMCNYTIFQQSLQISIMDVPGDGIKGVDDDSDAVDVAELRRYKELIVENEEEKPFMLVEQLPQYPGGESKLWEFVSDNLKYPEKAVKEGIQGRVVVRFVVNKDGRLSDIQIVKPLHVACNEEVIRVVKAMPAWIPGKQNGRNVPVYFTLPITFKLPVQEEKSTSEN